MENENSIPTNPFVSNTSRTAKILIGFYLAFTMVLFIFLLLKALGAPNAGSDTAKVIFFTGYYISTEVQRALLVIFAGAIGALIHVLRSFIWHIGKKDFDLDWLPFYFLHPLSGATLALTIYLVMRGGFMNAPSSFDPTGVYSFIALALLVGSFSENAWTKFKQVAVTIFSESDRQPVVTPIIEDIDPKTGTQNGNEDVKIKGTGFQSDSKVKFGEKFAGTVVFDKDNNMLNVKTPASDSANEVNVVVINGDKTSNAVKFTYTNNV